ncbi:tRNA (guanine26-N2/guanine27-N2)-dimethyltransferase [Pancytospora philotis]|nr:tRNA (guanine26-N2/guanine27-N2)-dimethyltransferase [Pancytospora philotis]
MTVECFEEGSARIEKSEDSFYNPAQKLNRDMSVEIIKSYFAGRESVRILDAMAATGLRGIRYLNEIPNSQVFLNDISESAIATIKNNLALNGYDSFGEGDSSREPPAQQPRVNLSRGNCIDVMNRHRGFFDVIDIDPFGSCADFVNEAFRAVRHNGLILFTCTDKAALCSNERKCYMRYGTQIKHVYAKNETATRTLLSHISRELAKYDASIVPIASLSVDFYVRVVVRVKKNNGKAALSNNSHVLICGCLNRRELPFGAKIDPVCDVCAGAMRLYGPFWNKSLYDRPLIARIIADLPAEGNERMLGILKLMEQEIDDLFYYELSELCSKLKTNSCRLRELMNALVNAGYRASLVHYDNNAIKTSAPLAVINEAMREKAAGTPGKYVFDRNEAVDAIYAQNYYKGKIMSGLKPLALPRKK